MRDEILKTWNETREKLEKKNINELNKDTIVKIIDLNENLSNSIYNSIEILLKEKIYDENTVKEEIILMKIKSILEDIKKKKYEKKTTYQNYTIYYYSDHNDIFVEEKDTENIMKEIKSIENAKNLTIYEGRKQLLFSEKIVSQEVRDIIDENRINPIKIRINF